MLLAVEGGGFFSSSVSGYSSSLTLLLLGQKSEDKPMRVSPLLVDREPDLNIIQLASTKTWISWGCASSSFRCFRQTPAGPTPSPLKKAATTQRQDSLRTSPLSDNGKNNHVPSSGDDNIERKMVLKSSLKKASDAPIVSVPNDDGNEALGGKGSCDSSHVERRKVQWTDTCGSELAEVKEFEPRCALDPQRSADLDQINLLAQEFFMTEEAVSAILDKQKPTPGILLVPSPCS